MRLCHEAGLVKLGVVALDGTKVAANAALATNRSHQAIEEEVQRIWQRPRQRMLKRMPITVPTGEGMSYRKGWGDGQSGSGA